MPNLRPAKFAGLMVLVLLVGSNLILPAGAHVTSNLSHLQGHLDPRYINVNETAANANLLDGQDSSAFLGANAKAADSNLLDGQDSSAFLGANAQAADANLLDGKDSTVFMAGPGKVIEGAVSIPNLGACCFTVLLEESFFAISYRCPVALSDNGMIRISNQGGITFNVFSDNGGTNPAYQQLPGAGMVWDQPAAATGEYYEFQVHRPGLGIATITVMSVHRASDCHVQAQAVISN